jgi:hypothetical protein
VPSCTFDGEHHLRDPGGSDLASIPRHPGRRGGAVAVCVGGAGTPAGCGGWGLGPPPGVAGGGWVPHRVRRAGPPVHNPPNRPHLRRFPHISVCQALMCRRRLSCARFRAFCTLPPSGRRPVRVARGLRRPPRAGRPAHNARNLPQSGRRTAPPCRMNRSPVRRAVSHGPLARARRAVSHRPLARPRPAVSHGPLACPPRRVATDHPPGRAAVVHAQPARPPRASTSSKANPCRADRPSAKIGVGSVVDLRPPARAFMQGYCAGTGAER